MGDGIGVEKGSGIQILDLDTNSELRNYKICTFFLAAVLGRLFQLQATWLLLNSWIVTIQHSPHFTSPKSSVSLETNKSGMVT